MKKTLTVISLLAGATGLYAQGTVALSAYNGNCSVLIYAPATPGAAQIYGAGPNDLTPGSTVYAGVPIGGGSTGSGPTAYGNGNNYTVAVYAVPGEGNTSGLAAAEAAGTADAILTSKFFTTGGTGSSQAGTLGYAGIYTADYLSGATTAIPGATTGATLQILCWYSGSGNTYATDSSGSLLPYGSSTIAEIAQVGGQGVPPGVAPIYNNSTPPAPNMGLYSFSLTENVPEPSTIALGVIGASTLLFRRRK